MEFARRYLEGLRVEVLGHDVHAGRVAYEDYSVGKLFGKQVEMKHRAVGIDNQL